MSNPALKVTFDNYLDALERGDRRRALAVVKQGVAAGCHIRDIYLYVLQPAMYEIGRLWELNQLTVAQEHLATAITQSVMAHFYADVFVRSPNGRTMLATCTGSEQHQLGIRMVADFFEMEGWNVYFLGANVPPGGVVEMVEERKADLVAISITLPTHLAHLRAMIAALRCSSGSARAKIMVGGQPLYATGETAASLGADLMPRDAREAIELARSLLP
ncbi:cobalamin B12-binding domain-containing protein [Polyangium aurulentum]|uniref:cobalamin B12-binding domain-containing protein n=1 Tax=Polyangium aurulentum TaxID=2567896 RepID=UPI0010ADC33C|nr:cobalamin-dependent protein [Polyangium aurulentum]UQA56191.1 cobalamin-dependent protein [Polyangium aurulentum]